MFEKMVHLLLEECSRKEKGDFKLTNIVKGYWNKADGTDIEIDIVAINEAEKIIRLGSCKRSQDSHDDHSLKQFNGHIDRYMTTPLGRKCKTWKVERALYSPIFTSEMRTTLSGKGYICVDLPQFREWLLRDNLPLFATADMDHAQAGETAT